LNLCRSCNKDFGSVSAFDAHRVGKHAYTYSEGVKMEPMKEDGRRCLATWELIRDDWLMDYHDVWRLPASQKDLLRLRVLTESRR
jgi:hypothetical protein